MPNNNEAPLGAQNQVVVEMRSSLGQTAWFLWIAFWICGTLFLGVVFLPLTILMSVIALVKRSFLLGIVSAVLAVLIILTSPTIWIAYWGAKTVHEEIRKEDQAKRAVQKTMGSDQQESTVANQKVSEWY